MEVHMRYYLYLQMEKKNNIYQTGQIMMIKNYSLKEDLQKGKEVASPSQEILRHVPHLLYITYIIPA